MRQIVQYNELSSHTAEGKDSFVEAERNSVQAFVWNLFAFLFIYSGSNDKENALTKWMKKPKTVDIYPNQMQFLLELKILVSSKKSKA